MPVPYCLNIHPGESLAAAREALETHARAVKARVAPDAPYPVGLRLGAAAAEELAAPDAREAFRALLDSHGFVATGINGFPYGAFHGAPVKTAVYRPDWSTPERLAYTGRLAELLAELLPPGGTGSVSTVPLAYRAPAAAGAADDGAAVRLRAVAVMAAFLRDLQARTGREIVLALEPEPDCLLEAVDDTLAWFEHELLREGARWLCANRRRTPQEAEELLRAHVGLCLDTCHFAVAFEDPLEAFDRFERAGLRVARVQLSNALRATVSDAALERLAAFVDPVYLHQTKLRLPGGRLLALPDLTPETLGRAAAHPGCELRTHFHVPLFYAGDEVLQTTQEALSPAFFRRVAARGTPLEIETYTFDVLPPALRAGGVVESLVRETAWVEAALPAPR